MKQGIQISLWLVILLAWAGVASAQERARRPRESSVTASVVAASGSRGELDKQIAAHFAPVLYQGIGDQPRGDYVTNFDFDGDWQGDNNWRNLDNKSFLLRAYVYYSVSETPTHYFVHYAFFHPRDYKGGLVKSTILDSILRQTLPTLGKDPTGMADDIALSHENDLEGCLVVAAKRGNDFAKAQVQFVETMAHNKFLKYRAAQAPTGTGDLLEMEGARPRLFIEPKGHGVLRYTGDELHLNRRVTGMLTYIYQGRAETPAEGKLDQVVGYDLVPIFSTLWSRALQGEGDTYGETFDYQKRTVVRQSNGSFSGNKAPLNVEQHFGSVGAAFRGTVGFKNKARPPWGWFDAAERDRPLGEWFFDPASVIARHYEQSETKESFALTYLQNLYFGIGK